MVVIFFSKPSTITEALWIEILRHYYEDHNLSQCTYILDSDNNAEHKFLAILCFTNVFSSRKCADIHVYRPQCMAQYYGILATGVNPVMVSHSGTITESAGPDALPKL